MTKKPEPSKTAKPPKVAAKPVKKAEDKAVEILMKAAQDQTPAAPQATGADALFKMTKPVKREKLINPTAALSAPVVEKNTTVFTPTGKIDFSKSLPANSLTNPVDESLAKYLAK